MLQVLAVGFGGFIGAVSRYFLSGWVNNINEAFKLAVGTAAVNILGCLAIGFLVVLFEVKGWVNEELRLFLFVGILGGFTTFSTFGLETFLLFEKGQPGIALLNIGAQVVLGLLAVWLGYMAANGLLR